MPGYHRRPDLTAEALVDGWIRSGDLGYVDDDGFLYLVDRKKDLVISGGVNVYPRDIEEVAIRHPDVLDVAVFGVPDERWGESPIAAVRLRPGADARRDELRDWINEHVDARFQRVREVVLRERLPDQPGRQDAPAGHPRRLPGARRDEPLRHRRLPPPALPRARAATRPRSSCCRA